VTGLEALFDELARLVAEKVVALLRANGRDPPPAEPDHLLTLTQAAERLGVSMTWLRRHSAGLPFTRKLSHRVVRFSSTGIERWLSRPGSQVLRGPENPRPASTPQGRRPRRDPQSVTP